METLRAHSHSAQVPCAMPMHTRPSFPLTHCLALTLLQSDRAWARLSYLINRVGPVFSLTFLLSCNKIFKFFSGIRNLKDSLGFFHCSLSGLCCCLLEFKVNPSQTVTVMSVLLVCAWERATIPCWSPPLPTAPRPTQHAALGCSTVRSHESNKLEFGGQMCSGTVWIAESKCVLKAKSSLFNTFWRLIKGKFDECLKIQLKINPKPFRK